MRVPSLSPLLAGLLLAAGACAAPSATGDERFPVVAADRTGCRIQSVVVTRTAEGWKVSGWLEGAWLRTASRREVEVEALDAGGATLASARATAHRHARGPDKIGVDSARFEIDLPGAATAASFSVGVSAR